MIEAGRRGHGYRLAVNQFPVTLPLLVILHRVGFACWLRGHGDEDSLRLQTDRGSDGASSVYEARWLAVKLGLRIAGVLRLMQPPCLLPSVGDSRAESLDPTARILEQEQQLLLAQR